MSYVGNRGVHMLTNYVPRSQVDPALIVPNNNLGDQVPNPFYGVHHHLKLLRAQQSDDHARSPAAAISTVLQRHRERGTAGRLVLQCSTGGL